jgi:hypothetical protein
LNLAELQIQATSSQTEILVANDVQRLDTRSRMFLVVVNVRRTW